MSADLEKACDRVSFDPEKLTEFLYNGKEKVNRRRFLQSLVYQDGYLQSFKPSYNHTREEAYDTNVKKSTYALQLCQKLGIVDKDEQDIVFDAALPNEMYLFDIHRNMFIPTVELQGTKEQHEMYLEPATKYQIVGAYAQTELGHGTFIRGLETTATYDTETQEFVMNSPTLTSMKYWPGILGKTANFAIVMAQLYSGGRCHGLHAFAVQLRSLEDHSLLPGVQTGDIGNKMGYAGMDNGWLVFDNYRVPRLAMLMRYARIEKDGMYVAAQDTRLVYGTMERENCHMSEKRQLLDCQTQQHTLLPLIAATYALMLAGAHLEHIYTDVMGGTGRDTLNIQALHAQSCGLKALTTYTVSDGVDKLRRACGAHGYLVRGPDAGFFVLSTTRGHSMDIYLAKNDLEPYCPYMVLGNLCGLWTNSHASGLPKIFANITTTCTYDGENTVLEMQCGRFLVKWFSQINNGAHLPECVSFLGQETPRKSSVADDFTLAHLVEAYEHVSKRLVEAAANKVASLVDRGTARQEAYSLAGVHLIKASEMFSRTLVVKLFCKELENANVPPTVARVLQNVCMLYAVSGINDRLGDFMQDGFLCEAQAVAVEARMLSLLDELCLDAVLLVVALDFRPEALQSCLAGHDGHVYESLVRYAQDSPLNRHEVLDSYHTSLRPLMNGQLHNAKSKSKL